MTFIVHAETTSDTLGNVGHALQSKNIQNLLALSRQCGNVLYRDSKGIILPFFSTNRKSNNKGTLCPYSLLTLNPNIRTIRPYSEPVSKPEAPNPGSIKLELNTFQSDLFKL